jgi:hypothetical protein
VAVANGLVAIKRWNISQLLTNLGGAVIKLPGGWSLTDEGQAALRELGVSTPGPSKALKPMLRGYVANIPSKGIKEFLAEAIGALEMNLYRAAVVPSWVGAVSILYDLVLKNHLAAFNAEAVKRFPKWKSVNVVDDFSKIKEFEFLQILHALSIIGKNTKDELEQCLKLRNACGHPSGSNLTFGARV